MSCYIRRPRQGGPPRAPTSKEFKFAAVRAALRKQSLTFESYSEEVVVALWRVLKARHAAGERRMLRKELQQALLNELEEPLASQRMSKNKINKIFQ
ncbi:unnamed protein product, partial [Phaeothamnion confervicola]